MSTDADRYACPQCSEIHERVCARIAADRIAALEAAIAEVTKRCADMAEIAERRGVERDAAHVELARVESEAINVLQMVCEEFMDGIAHNQSPAKIGKRIQSKLPKTFEAARIAVGGKS